MDLATAIFTALAAGLLIWKSKESRRYLDKLMKLKREYYAEKNKERPNMAVLDNLEFELGLLVTAFSAEAAKQKAGDTP